jgi:CheY-like chemotaxis protein
MISMGAKRYSCLPWKKPEYLLFQQHTGRTAMTLNEIPRQTHRYLPRILVVDANAFWQSLTISALQGLGYPAEVAGNSLDALDQIERSSYDIILMDLEMPLMDGLEITRQIRANQDGQRQQPYIVAITNRVDPDMRQTYLDAGINAYLGKPIWPHHLLNILQSYFSACSGIP